MRISKHRLIAHDATETKVTQLNVLISVKEYIARLEISVQNLVALFSHMTFKQGERQL